MCAHQKMSYVHFWHFIDRRKDSASCSWNSEFLVFPWLLLLRNHTILRQSTRIKHTTCVILFSILIGERPQLRFMYTCLCSIVLTFYMLLMGYSIESESVSIAQSSDKYESFEGTPQQCSVISLNNLSVYFSVLHEWSNSRNGARNGLIQPS